MHPSDPSSAPPGSPPSAEDRLRASRRAAILRGLSKGATAAAAVAPLNTLAAPATNRNFVYPSTALGKQCTVSGQQSAAVSTNPLTNKVCVAYHPSYFITSTQIDLSVNNQLQAGGAENWAAVQDLRGTTKLVGRVYYSSTGTAVYIKTSQEGSSGGTVNNGKARKITFSANLPSGAGLSTLSLVNAVFPGAVSNANRTILEQLFRWNTVSTTSVTDWGVVAGTTPPNSTSGTAPATVGTSPVLTASGTVGESDLAYFLAAYLTTFISGAVGFDGQYVKTKFSIAAERLPALEFFKMICQTGKVTTSLP